MMSKQDAIDALRYEEKIALQTAESAQGEEYFNAKDRAEVWNMARHIVEQIDLKCP